MKFAKVLLFICAITLCSALERTVSKVEAEYRAETEALKIAVGYRELMQETTETSSSIQNVELIFGDSKAAGTTQPFSTDIKSGIAIHFNKNPNANVIKNTIRFGNSNTYYVPYNTITSVESVEIDDKDKKFQIKLFLDNNSGPSTAFIKFLDLDSKRSSNRRLVNTYKDQFEVNREQRKSDINSEIRRVKGAGYEILGYQEDIADAKKSDAEIKRKKEEEIKKLEKQIADLKKQIATQTKIVEESSKKLVKVKNTLTTKENEKTTLISKRDATLKSIEILKNNRNTDKAIQALEAAKKTSEDQLKYWLKGSVYHRIISENEMTELIGLVLQDKQFDDKVKGFFHPQ